jgi:hypothetical protein
MDEAKFLEVCTDVAIMKVKLEKIETKLDSLLSPSTIIKIIALLLAGGAGGQGLAQIVQLVLGGN